LCGSPRPILKVTTRGRTVSRRNRRSWGKRALAHETRSRIAKVEELAEAGYEPSVIAPAAKLPQAFVEEMLRLASHKGGGGLT
jgi:hypothetical protein